MRETNQKVNFKLGEALSGKEKLTADVDKLFFLNNTVTERKEQAEAQILSLTQQLEIHINESKRYKDLIEQLKNQLSEAGQKCESQEDTMRD